jgi:hypothetical protein
MDNDKKQKWAVRVKWTLGIFGVCVASFFFGVKYDRRNASKEVQVETQVGASVDIGSGDTLLEETPEIGRMRLRIRVVRDKICELKVRRDTMQKYVREAPAENLKDSAAILRAEERLDSGECSFTLFSGEKVGRRGWDEAIGRTRIEVMLRREKISSFRSQLAITVKPKILRLEAELEFLQKELEEMARNQVLENSATKSFFDVVIAERVEEKVRNESFVFQGRPVGPPASVCPPQ